MVATTIEIGSNLSTAIIMVASLAMVVLVIYFVSKSD